MRYSDDGSLTKPGKLPLNLLRVNLLRLLGEDWAKEHGLDVDNLSAGDIHTLNSVHLGMLPGGERLRAIQVPDDGTVTESPHTVTVCGTPRTATASEVPCAETPSPTMCGAPRTTVTEPPHTTVTEPPHTRFVVLPEGTACLPSCLPSQPKPESIEEGRTGGRMEGFSEEKPPTMDEEDLIEIELQKEIDEELQKVLSNLPEVMRGAVFGKNEKEMLRKQIANRANSKIVLAALTDWIANRELPIEGRKTGKWKCWFDECPPFIQKARNDFFEANERAAWVTQWKAVTANASVSAEALKHGRKFIESEWSYGDSDKNTLREMSEETRQHQEQGFTLPISEVRYQSRFLRDLLERFTAWNVVCNGAPIPKEYSEEDDWNYNLGYIRRDIAKNKVKLSGK